MMNNAIATVLIRTVRQLTSDVQSIPRELLDQHLRETKEQRQKLSDEGRLTAPLAELYDDEVTRCTLILQWCNQAKEQLSTESEMLELSKRAAPDLVDILLRRGGLTGK